MAWLLALTSAACALSYSGINVQTTPEAHRADERLEAPQTSLPEPDGRRDARSAGKALTHRTSHPRFTPARAPPRPRTPPPRRAATCAIEPAEHRSPAPSSSARAARPCRARARAPPARASARRACGLGLAHLAQHVRGDVQRESPRAASAPRCLRLAPSRPAPRRRATAARWTEPSCHHDQTSSQTNGRNGASSRWKTDSETRSARLDRGARPRASAS